MTVSSEAALHVLAEKVIKHLLQENLNSRKLDHFFLKGEWSDKGWKQFHGLASSSLGEGYHINCQLFAIHGDWRSAEVTFVPYCNNQLHDTFNCEITQDGEVVVQSVCGIAA